MGAGRTNATPNLDDGKFFLGNSSNQSASATFSTSVTGIALPLSGGAMTGAITTNSTFDGRDVATDGSKLDGIEASADVTDTANVTAAGALMDSELTSIASVKALDQGVATTDSPTFAGLTTSADVSFGDNDKAIFGAGSDLQIYHDGSNSYISDQGTGNLVLQGSNLTIEAADGTNYIAADDGVSVYIYHPDATNQVKLSTTSTGIDVTGTATMDGLTVETTNGLNAVLESANSYQYLQFKNTQETNNYLGFVGDDFSVTAANKKYLQVDGNGDISFYEDTGTAPKLFWDASAESLGIGTSSPAKLLHLSESADGAKLRITRAGVSEWDFSIGNTSTLTGVGAGALEILPQVGGTSNELAIGTAGSAVPLVHITNSQNYFKNNLLVGTTTTTINTSSSVSGHNLFSSGYTVHSRSGQTVMSLNRLSNDGTIVDFRKDGSVVGNIGTQGGDLYLGTDDANIKFFNSASIQPVNSVGGARDNAIDIGASSARFKDLYLSGAVNLTNSTTTAFTQVGSNMFQLGH